MKFYVTRNAAYSLEDVHKVEKKIDPAAISYSNYHTYFLSIIYNNHPKETIVYYAAEDRDKAFDEILNILKGE